MKFLIIAFLAVVGLSAAADRQTFTGTIADDMCGAAGHSRMQMGPTDAECTRACISAHGAAYVLDDGKNLYTLSDEKKPEPLAGQKLKVVGTLDPKSKTITVESISAVATAQTPGSSPDGP
jgi:hypothetical protein